jgi:hypothetical protein
MTIRQLIHLATERPLELSLFFAITPLLSLFFGLILRPAQIVQRPWKYVYTALVYLSVVPGMFASVVFAYTLFFTHENLLDVNLLIYLLPIISMIITLVLINQKTSFESIPGFNRLSGLIALIGVSFFIALAIQKSRIFVFFGASIGWLFIIAFALFIILKWGGLMLFGKKSKLP